MDEGYQAVTLELGKNYEALQKELERTEVVLAAVRAGAAEREAKMAILADAAAERTEEAEAANTKLDNTRSLLEKQDARVNRLSDELGAANARIAEADATIAHLRKAKNCYYDCVDKAEANQRIAEAETKAMDIARPLVEKAEAKVAELELQLAERTAQLREVQGNWKKYEPFVSRMQEAEAKAASWKEAHERAAVIAGEELNKQRAEFEAGNARLRAVVEAADRYDRCKIGYPAFRIALNKWRKSQTPAAEAVEGEKEKES